MLRKLYTLLLYLDEIPCRQCGCREFETVTTDWIGNVEAEKEVRCVQCRSVHNNWAYGRYQWAFTYSEMFRDWICTIVVRWRNR